MADNPADEEAPVDCPKVVFVIGTTGAGKTKLSLDLADAIGGEIVSSDAIQLYRGLDIASAKATLEEQARAVHHMLDVSDPLAPDGAYTVIRYKAEALTCIREIAARGKVPIVVGGTNYYVEALMFEEAVAEATIAELVAEQSAAGDDVAALPDTPSHGEGDAADNGRDLWNKLAAVDVAAAERLHPNQRRKIKRALEIFHTHGVKASDVAARQAERERVLLVDPCVVWVHSEWGPLAERLDTRVDRMMAAGLLDEVRAFREALDNAPREVVEGNRGVLQAIGFKEFDPYFEAIKTGGEEGESVDADVVLAACVDKLKRATRKYARKQLTWIRNAFVRRGVSVFRVDSTDPSTWDDAVLGPALATVARFLDGHGAVSNVDLGADGDDASDALNRNKFVRCETCCRDLQGQRQWEVHIRSRKHRRAAKVKRRRQTRPAHLPNHDTAATTSGDGSNASG